MELCHGKNRVRLTEPFGVSGVFRYFGSSQEEPTTLYVPYYTKAKYEAAGGWDVFDNIMEMERPIVPGDVDGNGKTDESDIESIANYVAGKNVESFDKDAADIDMNGVVDIRDLTLLIKALVNGE